MFSNPIKVLLPELENSHNRSPILISTCLAALEIKQYFPTGYSHFAESKQFRTAQMSFNIVVLNISAWHLGRSARVAVWKMFFALVLVFLSTWVGTESLLFPFPELNGRVLTAGAFNVPGETEQTARGGWRGSFIEYINYLSQLSNFSVIYLSPEDLTNDTTEIYATMEMFDAIDSGRLDLQANTRTPRLIHKFHYVQPALYHAYKPMFLVDRPLFRQRAGFDALKVFRVYEFEIWLVLFIMAGAIVTIGAVKTWVQGGSVVSRMSKDLNRISAYFGTKVSRF